MASYLAPQELFYTNVSKDYLEGFSVKNISEKYNCTSSNIYRILYKKKIKMRSNEVNNRKYDVDHTFFNIIDTEEKAYTLGFLYADGYNNERDGVVKLALHEKDKEILEKISYFIQPTKPLYFLNHQRRRNNNSKVSDSYCLSISSKYICKQLSILGCTQKKTFSLKFPTPLQVPNDLLNHFIRGYFDGDGCIKIARNSKKQSFSLTGTEPFLTHIQELLTIKLKLPNTKLYTPLTQLNTNIRVLSHSSLLSCLKIKNYLYSNATIYLKRKYDTFNTINFEKICLPI